MNTEIMSESLSGQMHGFQLWTKSENMLQYIWRSELQWGSRIPEVRYYGVMERVWSQRDLASTYVLHYYHVLVPNFGNWSIGVWPEVQTKKRTYEEL